MSQSTIEHEMIRLYLSRGHASDPPTEEQIAEMAAKDTAARRRSVDADAAISPEWQVAVDFLVEISGYPLDQARQTVGSAILDGCPDPETFIEFAAP